MNASTTLVTRIFRTIPALSDSVDVLEVTSYSTSPNFKREVESILNSCDRYDGFTAPEFFIINGPSDDGFMVRCSSSDEIRICEFGPGYSNTTAFNADEEGVYEEVCNRLIDTFAVYRDAIEPTGLSGLVVAA